MSSLKVLIVNRSMHATSGTELYVRDVALELKKQGHCPVVFTPEPGCVSAQLIAEGISVVSEVESLGQAPDVIHGQHAWTTLAVLVRFPDTPAIFVGHDATAWTDTPPRLPQIRRYVAVDLALRNGFVEQFSISDSQVRLIPNAIDFGRFRKRGPLPARPKRALLISNYSGARERDEIQAACDAREISLDAVGRRFGNMTSTPELLYAEYDLVFAKGRCVLEAAAAGTAVIYCDTWGCGPMLSSGDLDRGEGILAGRHLLSAPLQRDILLQRIDAYDSEDARLVSDRIRAAYNAPGIVSRLIELYRDAIDEHLNNTESKDPVQSKIAMARQLIWWSQNAESIFQRHQIASARLLPNDSAQNKSTIESAQNEDRCVRYGPGWYPPERDERGEFRWMGPDQTACVDLVVPESGAKILRCYVAHSMAGELMRELKIQINGEHSNKAHLWDEGPVIWSRIPNSVTTQPGTRLRVVFQLPRTIRAKATGAGNSDHRLLGIAFRHITLETEIPQKSHPAQTIAMEQSNRRDLSFSETASADSVYPPMPIVFGSPKKTGYGRNNS